MRTVRRRVLARVLIIVASGIGAVRADVAANFEHEEAVASVSPGESVLTLSPVPSLGDTGSIHVFGTRVVLNAIQYFDYWTDAPAVPAQPVQREIKEDPERIGVLEDASGPASITAVPEPGAIVLLPTVLGLIAVRRSVRTSKARN